MAKCALCGKFLSSTNCVRYSKCTGSYHRLCGSAPTTGPTPPGWSCQQCKNRSAKCCSSPNEAIGQADMNIDLSTSNQILNELTKEIKCLRKEFSAMRHEISEFKTDLLACNNRVTILKDKISKLEEKIENKVTADTSHFETTIAEIKLKQLNEREQELFLNDIEISGLPEKTPNESVLHLTKLVALNLDVQVDDVDIAYAERVGFLRRNRTLEELVARPCPRALVIRFTRRALRDDMLRAARVRRGLTTADIDLPGELHRFYSNERLTKANRQLFGKSREAASNQKWKYSYVWTKNSSIFAKNDNGKAVERVRNESDVYKIFHL